MMEETWSVDEEEFRYDSLAELLDCNSELVVGDTVYVGNATIPDASRFIHVTSIIEGISECAWDNMGECAEEWPDLSKEEEILLEEMISDFLNKHSPIKFYGVSNVKKYIITAEDVS